MSDKYGDFHKLVLQGMMSSGILGYSGVMKLFFGACTYLKLPSEERTTMPYIQKVVREINKNIRDFNMAIKSASCELTGKKYYMFLMTVDNPMLKLQTHCTQFEIRLFEKIIDTVFHKYPNFSAPFAECINFANDLDARGTLEQAEHFITRMIEMSYLTKFPLGGEDFDITLGIRGIRELEPLFRRSGVLTECMLCKTLLLHGYLCPQCRTVIHRPCYTRYVKKNLTTCPRCDCCWEDKSKMLPRTREEDEEHDLAETAASLTLGRGA